MSVVVKSESGPIIMATYGSSGFDLRANIDKDLVIKVGERALISTGVSLFNKFDDGFPWEAQVRPRSSLTLKGIDGGLGTIDSDYTGDIKVILMNNSKEDYTVKPQDKVGQLVFVALYAFVSGDVLIHTEQRGDNGFGSTGR